jgi:predicted AAA+ superfamily ATPase
MIKRYLEDTILEDLKEKMVFISGPRQVGKTTMAMDLADRAYKDTHSYLNWDYGPDKLKIIKGLWQADKKLFILDEIHKYKKWKNFIKGEYDKHKKSFNIIVTGSAKLDIYRKGGDSLQGRYNAFRLHPLSVAEFSGHKEKKFIPFEGLNFESAKYELFESLYKFGGFPEPFSAQSERKLRRWQLNRVDRLINDDIKSVEYLKDITDMEILVGLLPSKVGSLFSLNSLREDLQAAHKTMASWVEILEKFYYHFRIYPFVNKLSGSYLKEPKLFLWDWSEIADPGARLENLVAVHLLKFCHYLKDVEGRKAELNFLKNKPAHEVDFLVTVDNIPWFCIEVKNSFERNLTSLKYYGKGLKIPYVYQVVNVRDTDLIKDNVRIISVEKFLTGLI